eukprot:TRINITY_DN11637_c0_g1_i1.p1 TRINITY_DN11637_c0_g1~~TRINITY_DN11637_c0_g1_i1.p1  ORF type:complete len:384 (-),score=101.87 TRINITY_DN11637_c0_g1_i1:142-1146(-)
MAANYPFCTIEPNSGKVTVPDRRLQVLQNLVHTEKVVPTQIDIVDIAGLVKGASKGEGKGNQFLSAIRTVDAVLHVVRCFDDAEIVHVDGSINPVRDIEIIDLELMLKDEETCVQKLEKNKKLVANNPEAALTQSVLEQVRAGLQILKPIRALSLSESDLKRIHDCHFITAKPMLFVCNISDSNQQNAYVQQVRKHAATSGAEVIVVSGRIEHELLALDDLQERAMFMKEMGLQDAGVNVLVRAAYDLLGLCTYFTAGVQEVRAWQMRKGWKAPRCAAVIHSDFEKKFVKAEVCSYDDFVTAGGEKQCRDTGKLRAEGRDYVVQDGDVIHFLCK